jgi:hypothetical protein
LDGTIRMASIQEAQPETYKLSFCHRDLVRSIHL